MTPRSKRFARPFLGLLLAVPVLASTACEGFEPTRLPVGDTVSLYSLARPEYIGRHSAFDFATPRAVVVEQPKSSFSDFDVAFSEADGEFVALPAGVFETFSIEPGIAVDSSGALFETLERAPSDGYVTDRPVPLEEDRLYIVRTRQQGICSQYAKFEVLELDPEGVIEFRFLRNNLCNDRSLADNEDE